MSNIASLPTVGVIARRLDQPVHRIEYLIRTRNIVPLGKAGNARVFSADAVDQIAAELRLASSARAEEVMSCR